MSKHNRFGWHYEWLDNSICTISLIGMATDKDNLFRGEARYLAHVCALTLPKGFTEQSAIEIYSEVIAYAAGFSCDEKYERCDPNELSIEAISQERELTKDTILACEGVASLLFAISLYESKKKEDAWAQLLHCQSLVQKVARNNAMAQEVITKNIREKSQSSEAYERMIQGASKGGYQAGKNRDQTRCQVKAETQKIIDNQNLWDDFSQTAKSITDTIWSEIEAVRGNGEDWQGISNADLLQAKVGRNTIYAAVKETDPR